MAKFSDGPPLKDGPSLGPLPFLLGNANWMKGVGLGSCLEDHPRTCKWLIP